MGQERLELRLVRALSFGRRRVWALFPPRPSPWGEWKASMRPWPCGQLQSAESKDKETGGGAGLRSPRGGWTTAKVLPDTYGHFMPTESRGFADALAAASDGPQAALAGSAPRCDPQISPKSPTPRTIPATPTPRRARGRRSCTWAGGARSDASLLLLRCEGPQRVAGACTHDDRTAPVRPLPRQANQFSRGSRRRSKARSAVTRVRP